MTLLRTSLDHVLKSVAQDEVDLGEALPDEGITTDQWVTAGLTVVGFVVVAMVLGVVTERLIRKTDTEGQIASFVARMVRNVVLLVGIVYALGCG